MDRSSVLFPFFVSFPVSCKNGMYLHLFLLFTSSCSSNKGCPELLNFLSNKDIICAGVDIRGDRRAMATTWGGFQIPEAFHMDLQMLYQVNRLERTGMSAMATELISDHDKSMKSDFRKLLEDPHNLWEVSPLPEANLRYAAVDGYVSYEFYRTIKRLDRSLQRQPTYCPGCLQY